MTDHDYSIRFAESEEFPLVRNLDPHSKYIDPHKIELKVNNKQVILLIISNSPAGLVKFSYFWDTRPYLDLIWIKKQYRGKGYGRELLKFLEKYLVKNGYHYLLSSSQENEPKPQKWHKKQDFIECGKLSAINLPQENVNEIFFYKKISNKDQAHMTLNTYPVLP